VSGPPGNHTGQGLFSSPAGALPDGILGLGVDLCAVARLDRQLAAEDRGVIPSIFVAAEIARCDAHRYRARAYAAVFAAKEAVIKSLARARGQGTFWLDIEVGDDAHGRPVVTLRGRLRALAEGLGVRRIHVSHAHDRDHAVACAIVTGGHAHQRRSRKPCL
jgi:holo-[acyl-carrier protein] synthase